MILFTVLFLVIWRCDSSVCLFLPWIYVRVWMLMILWCVLEKVREKKDGIVDTEYQRCIYHVNTSVLYSGDPQVTTLLGNSHTPPHAGKKWQKGKRLLKFPLLFPWLQCSTGVSQVSQRRVEWPWEQVQLSQKPILM